MEGRASPRRERRGLAIRRFRPSYRENSEVSLLVWLVAVAVSESPAVRAVGSVNVKVVLPVPSVVTVSEPSKVLPWPADWPAGVSKNWMVKLLFGTLVNEPETVLPEPVTVGKFWPSLGNERGLAP